MITDEEIKRIAEKHELTPEDLTTNFAFVESRDAFARAIYQLGRQHQRESDAKLCIEISHKRSNQGNHIGFNAMHQCAEAIRNNTGEL